MSVLHLVATLLAGAATLLYADRTGYLWFSGSQTWAARLTRIGLGLVLLSVACGFAQLAFAGPHGAPFALRHWLIAAAFVVADVGLVAMRINHAPPT